MSPLPKDTQYPWWVTTAPKWVQPYMLLARLDRPIGTWLLLLPCWWGAALGAIAAGDSLPNLWHLCLFALGSILMRGAGCAFNDLVDKDIDAQVERTRARPLASGQLRRSQAAVFIVGLSLLGLVILLQFNALTIWLGIGSLGLVAAYPFMKRITWWPQAWLGLTFNWGALLGYTATTGDMGWPALCLYAAGIAWTLGYDTIYACQDVEDDALVGVRSTARLFAAAVPLWVGRFYAATLVLLLMAAIGAGASPFAAIILLAIPALFFARQYRSLHINTQAGAPDYLALFREHRTIGLFITLALCLL